MRTLLTAILLALLFPALPARAGDFATLQAKAEKVSSLSSFLETYVGECKDPFERVACRKNAEKRRKGLSGKLFYVRLLDRHSRLLQVARDLGGGRLRLVLTPFFDAAGYGLSRGRPSGLDAHGNPRIRLLPLTVQLPQGMDRRHLELAMRTGNLRMELIFVPGGVWRLPRHGDDAEGVSATFRGLRLTSARTGQTVAEVLW